MYAIVNDGSHQYRVEEGMIFEIQRRDLRDDPKTIEFDRVLMVGGEGGAKIGQPVLQGARVTASILGEIKGDKLITRKQNRRKGYKLKKGHRQKYLQVKVEKIQA